jgi:hypothetical protein
MSTEPSQDEISISALVQNCIAEARPLEDIVPDISSFRLAKAMSPRETVTEILEAILLSDHKGGYYELLEPFIQSEGDERFLIGLIEKLSETSPEISESFTKTVF